MNTNGTRKPNWGPNTIANLDQMTAADEEIQTVFKKDSETQNALDAFVETYRVTVCLAKCKNLQPGQTPPNEFDDICATGKEAYNPNKFWECPTLVDFVKGYKGIDGPPTNSYMIGAMRKAKKGTAW